MSCLTEMPGVRGSVSNIVTSEYAKFTINAKLGIPDDLRGDAWKE